ncbi:MAG: GntR family transcriptional regulator [Rhodospirillales bacterium]|nr:MAG: GntR family transcriptional regulator [Rhodospirillales bacterium]
MDATPQSEISEGPRALPLYAQVKTLLLQHLIAGEWRPGELLPSEFQLADRFGVSQGTVRKALDALAADNIVVRRQGRGTFVAEHDDHRALFHFFHLVGHDGARRLPESRLISVRKGLATRIEAEYLGIGHGAPVIRIRRVRSLDGQPAIAETITVPQLLFPDLADIRDVPNTLYDLYERRYGVTIARAVERLSAVAAEARDARLLAVPAGTPLLEIDRIALALDGKPVEWRLSRCLTTTHRYQVELG